MAVVPQVELHEQDFLETLAPPDCLLTSPQLPRPRGREMKGDVEMGSCQRR